MTGVLYELCAVGTDFDPRRCLPHEPCASCEELAAKLFRCLGFAALSSSRDHPHESTPCAFTGRILIFIQPPRIFRGGGRRCRGFADAQCCGSFCRIGCGSTDGCSRTGRRRADGEWPRPSRCTGFAHYGARCIARALAFDRYQERMRSRTVRGLHRPVER